MGDFKKEEPFDPRLLSTESRHYTDYAVTAPVYVYVCMYCILSSIKLWSSLYVFVYGSFNDAVNDEGYVKD